MRMIEDGNSLRITKHGRRLLKGDAVLAAIQSCLIWIPLKIIVHNVSMQNLSA